MEAGHLVRGNEGPLLGGGQETGSLETQQTLMTVRDWGEGSAEPGRAQSLPAWLCPPPAAPEWVLPAWAAPGVTESSTLVKSTAALPDSQRFRKGCSAQAL